VHQTIGTIGRGIAVAIALTAAFVLAAPGAHAESVPIPGPTPIGVPADGTYIEYTGTWNTTVRGVRADGLMEFPAVDGAVARIVCLDSACVLHLASLAELPIQWDSEGRFGSQHGEVGDACTLETGWVPGTATIAASASEIFIETTSAEEAYDGDVCDGFLFFGWQHSFTGVFSGGDPCVLAGDDCIPEPDPVEPEPDADVETGADPVTPDDTAVPIVPAARAPTGVFPAGSMLATGHPAAPSVLWTLPTAAQAPVSPFQLALAAAVTIILVLLVAFPASLLNSAVETASEKLGAWRRARRARVRDAHARQGGEGRADAVGAVPPGSGPASASVAPSVPTSDRAFSRPWLFAALGVVAAAVISCFVDPEFGVNPGSLRVLLGIVIAFVIDVIIGWSVTAWIARRIAPRATTTFHFAPLSLVVVVLAVVFTRMTGFEPGIIFGLVAGIVLGYAAAGAKGKVALALAGYTLGAGIVGWLLYSLLAPALVAQQAFWSALVIDTLSALAIAGVAAAPIMLLPVRGLAGRDVFAWSRWAWGGAYAAGLVMFFFVLMPMPFSWEEVSLSLWAWVGIYLAYVAVAVGGWLVIVQPWVRAAPEADRAAATTLER